MGSEMCIRDRSGQMAGAQLCSPVRHWRPGRVLDAGAAPQPPIRCALPVDHDEPGQTAARRLQEELQGAGYHSGILLPVHKDWNDDLTEQAEQDHAVQMVQQMG